MKSLNRVCFALVWAIIATYCPDVFGQPRDQSRVVVDMVYPKNQKPIRGFVLSHGTDELLVAVSKDWLKKEDPDAYLKAVESSQQAAAEAQQTLKARIQKLLEKHELPSGKKGALSFFLGKELERIEMEMEKPHEDSTQFVTLRIKPSTLSRVNIASEPNRKLAVWSWYERLVDVEKRKPSSLVDELKGKKVDPTLAPPDLTDRFYPTKEGDEQWAIRIAIVSHRLEKAIEFQGSGDVMLRIDLNNPQPDLTSLMGEMMQSQMSSLIQELTGTGKKSSRTSLEESDWIKSAISKAEAIQARYFRVTHVKTDLLADTSTVESAFLVQQANEKWTVAWKTTSMQNMADQKQDAIRQILDDPQIKMIQGQFESVGVNAGSLEKGIRAGAATMVAQKTVNNEFQLFTERYLKSLSQPPVTVPANKQ